ncbi:unnamed protein product [Ceutorhynchus assimilis]|uniref:Uncharacterized protein n=1 Tax=Ceutorhynchus assimilis TaxID=467358 RepID=A0A9N9QJB9_9CUCU|nr:unnamed protein product [Ceutorhynchus assimilis]
MSKLQIILLLVTIIVKINNAETECKPWTCAATLCLNVTPCPCGTILASGRGYCGCCFECVTPKIGDDCYKDDNGTVTCGPDLQCCKNQKCDKNCKRDCLD